MLALSDPRALPPALRGGALAIGNFDGVHRGHQVVLAEVKRIAMALPGPAGVMMFEPHPREFFQPDKPMFRITPRAEKLRILEGMAIELAVVIPFDQAFAALSAEAFIADVLVRDLGVRHVVVGHDFQFGKGRGGTVDGLRVAGQQFGFGVTAIVAQNAGGAVISSSRIRDHLLAGAVDAAADLLGRWWRVGGVVIGGAKRGTGLGFPTANIRLDPRQMFAHGIYAALVEIDGVSHAAAAYLGTRPTFDNGVPVLEVFLLDFDGDLYGQAIAVDFVKHLRSDREFASIEALVRQMQMDCDDARVALAAARDPGWRPQPLP